MAWAPKCKQEADGMGPRRFEWLGHRNADKRLMAVAPGSSHTSSGKARTPAPLASRQVRARLSSGHIPFQLLGGRWFQQYPFQRISDLAALDGGVWHPQSNGGMCCVQGGEAQKRMHRQCRTVRGMAAQTPEKQTIRLQHQLAKTSYYSRPAAMCTSVLPNLVASKPSRIHLAKTHSGMDAGSPELTFQLRPREHLW